MPYAGHRVNVLVVATAFGMMGAVLQALNTFSMLGILGHSKESETGFLLLRNLSSLKED